MKFLKETNRKFLKEQILSISKLNQKTKIISRHKSTNTLQFQSIFVLLIGNKYIIDM